MPCVVTAYYPLSKCKHSPEKYMEWIHKFFECVTCPVVCFCPPELEARFQTLNKGNVRIVPREFTSFKMMSPEWMEKWRTWYLVDPERAYHSPELYAVWAAKQEFVREAIPMVDSTHYVWCDIGCFRTERNGSFRKAPRYCVGDKLTCLHVSNTIGGGVLAGTPKAWALFSETYIKSLTESVNGKDQTVYNRILNATNATIIPANDSLGDKWFYLTYIFSD